MRLEATERFERESGNKAIAADLRVTMRSDELWRQAWRQGGGSTWSRGGPQSLPRAGERQFTKLERELEKGMLAHGWEDQRWTLLSLIG
ncbi:hypothetical protein ACFVT9_33565 [Kitasatospora cineracea]|uniref:hypothetical protein n=1 Tax=Kitasatospora cineracea TaxID=88074 RepID=UPI0036D83A8F